MLGSQRRSICGFAGLLLFCSFWLVSVSLALRAPVCRTRCSLSSSLHMLGSPVTSMPRLDANIPALYHWIKREGGYIHDGIMINQTDEGWTLVLKSKGVSELEEVGRTLASVPRRLCIYSSPSQTRGSEDPGCLLPATIELIKTVLPSQWRARLAIALLSERVRPKSFFYPYLANLPFEFWGLPMFFNSTEFEMIQDPSMMQRQMERCKFILEYATEALIPLCRTPLDPFSAHKPSVDAFGWAFAAASSRAFRSLELCDDDLNEECSTGEEEYGSGKVLIPLLDMASHSVTPNCRIKLSDDRTAYELKTLSPIRAGAEILIDYGPLSNEELFGDFGFSVDNNPHDEVMFKLDSVLIDAARAIMGQSLGSVSRKVEIDDAEEKSEELRLPPSPAPIGRALDEPYDERWLHQWQLIWLRALGLQNYCPEANFGMTLKGAGGAGQEGVDGRAYAFLRVLYAKKEEDLTKHGYDPQSLSQSSAILTSDLESQVLRTLVGAVGVLLRVYGTTEEADVYALSSGCVSLLVAEKAAERMQSDDIVADVQKIVRETLDIQEPLSMSPTARKYQLLNQLNREQKVDIKTNSSESSLISEDVMTVAANRIGLNLVDPYVEHMQELVSEDDKSGTSDVSFANHSSLSDERGWSLEQMIRNSIRFTGSGEDSDYVDEKKATDGIRNYLGEDRIREDFSSSKRRMATAELEDDEDNPIIADIRASRATSDIATLGHNLSTNVREVLRYRIRRKRAIAGILRSLASRYKAITQQRGIEGEEDFGDLLPDVKHDKELRKAKIRELLEEVRGENKLFSGKEEEILAAANAVSRRWDTKGLLL